MVFLLRAEAKNLQGMIERRPFCDATEQRERKNKKKWMANGNRTRDDKV